MNGEIFDYLKTLAKKEFFLVNLINCLMSIMIIVIGLLEIVDTPSDAGYPLMFMCATVIFALNAYKCVKRGSRNGWLFGMAGLVSLAICVLGLLKMFGGL